MSISKTKISTYGSLSIVWIPLKSLISSKLSHIWRDIPVARVLILNWPTRVSYAIDEQRIFSSILVLISLMSFSANQVSYLAAQLVECDTGRKQQLYPFLTQ